ncbi:MAG: serine--tRNA ligase [Nitrospirae bacterium]|nr:serine--tRNA ligase [Nitrospirota bacterium]
MLDIRFVRENMPIVREAMRNRRADESILEGIEKLEAERRRLIAETDELRNRRNTLSKEVGKRKAAGESGEALMAEVRGFGEKLSALESELADVETKVRDVLLMVPNIPHESVPVGADENDNVEIRRWGAPRDFSFEPKNHWDIGESLGILDFERAVKIAGARFALYKGLGARLERSILNFMLDVHTGEHGYTEIFPPIMVNSASMTGTGQLPKFREDLFKIENSDYFLIPTAEVPVTNIHRDEILDEKDLPVCYTAYTPCFRAEAGSHGKDTRGLIRQHQFNKVELVKFTTPESSCEEHEKLTANAEVILQRLGLPYRVIVLCTGDMGFSSAKTYDIEVWLPGQGRYREISSCSNFGDYQARRAGIRYRPEGKKKNELVHTLNGSGLAVGRTLVAILENYQQEDGSVIIPDALRSYMGTDRIAAG